MPPRNRGARGGQASRRLGAAAAASLVLSLGGCEAKLSEGKDCPPGARTNTVSGFCVPRWVSLKRGEVYGRKGPGKDYPAVWIYRARGLPVQIVAETQEWRRICDPFGGATWVNRSMVDGRRTALAYGADPIPLLDAPGGPKTKAMMVARSMGALSRCVGDWCRLKVEGSEGWAPAARLWGSAGPAQCK
ncbi:MAG TPA: SH3 domain-containing protein [Caulobacteraceae bacterium]|nr:SH3 domain-containing protein [Caulobacteraceae bacterium]